MVKTVDRNEFLAAVALVAITVLGYLPALSNGYIWDDDYHVTKNAALRSAAGLRDIWFKRGTTPQWYPLTHTTFWLEYQAWGLKPAGYHLVNVLLHGLGAALWWLVLKRLGLPPPAAWLAAAIFALHPVQVESVAWITERKNVLSGVFYVAAALAYLRFDDKRDYRFYALAAVLFVCALWSKSVAATLPAAIVLVVWWQRGRIRWSDVWPTLPLLALGAGFGWMTLHMEATHVGATGDEWAFSPADRLLIAGRALWFYGGKLIWPADLTFIYPRWVIEDRDPVQYLYPAAAMAVIVVLWALRRRIGRGPLAAVLFFCGTLTPALGFFNVFPMRYSFVADHFQYLACMGLIALAASMVCRYAVGVKVGFILLPALAMCTWQQAHMYRDARTLWETTLARNPAAWMAHNNLGIIQDDAGDYEKAAESFKQSIAYKPDNVEAMGNLAGTLLSLKQPREALEHLRTALELKPDHPSYLASMGQALLDLGQREEARARLVRALKLTLSDRDEMYLALYNLGKVDLELKAYEESAGAFEAAAALRPADAHSLVGLGKALDRLGKPAESAAAYERALAIDSRSAEAHHDYALLLGRSGRMDDAMKHLDEAIAANPRYASAHANKAVLLMHMRRPAEAVAAYEEAIALEPKRQETLRALAWIYATHPDGSIRNGARAMALAEEANMLTGGNDSRMLDALAAAYAESGRFFQAIATAELAVSRAESLGRHALAEQMRQRLELYRQNRAYRAMDLDGR